jgi:hypothetical protein
VVKVLAFPITRDDGDARGPRKARFWLSGVGCRAITRSGAPCAPTPPPLFSIFVANKTTYSIRLKGDPGVTLGCPRRDPWVTQPQSQSQSQSGRGLQPPITSSRAITGSPDFFVPPLPYPLCTLISTQGHPIPGPRHARFSRGGVEGTQGQAEGRNPKMRKPDLKPGGNTKLVDRRHPRLRSCLQTNNETMLAWLPLRSDKNR